MTSITKNYQIFKRVIGSIAIDVMNKQSYIRSFANRTFLLQRIKRFLSVFMNDSRASIYKIRIFRPNHFSSDNCKMSVFARPIAIRTNLCSGRRSKPRFATKLTNYFNTYRSKFLETFLRAIKIRFVISRNPERRFAMSANPHSGWITLKSTTCRRATHLCVVEWGKYFLTNETAFFHGGKDSSSFITVQQLKVS